MANPNPSPSTRFGAPNGNDNTKGGKTSEQKRLEYEAAEMAAKVRHHLLTVITETIEELAPEDKQAALNFAKGDYLKLFKDSEDRAHGTPKATSEVSGPDGGAIPVSQVEFTIFDPKETE